jgi:hypothetical protein
MSITHEQWCLPKDSNILQKAMQEVEYCQCFEFIWFDDADISNQHEAAYLADMKHTKKFNAYTGNSFQFNKSWDAIFFCLSKNRRLQGPETEDIYAKAIFGETEINKQAKTVEGFSIKYLSYLTLQKVLQEFEYVSYERFVSCNEDSEWQKVYGGSFYNPQLCWIKFLSWKRFLMQARVNLCDVVCVTS